MFRSSASLLLVLSAVFLATGPFAAPGHAADDDRYVGIEVCSDCHPEQYEAFKARSPKASSSKGVTKLLSDLDPDERAQCFGCHTTGYGKPGGFVSFQETPLMGNIGCESCHGPGRQHVEGGGDPSLLAAPSPGQQRCDDCHDPKKREGLVRILKSGMAH